MGTVTRLFDGLANVLSGRGTSVDRLSHNHWTSSALAAQQIEAAYRYSWLHRKIVDIPAQDMTRAGRDWDGDKADIEKIEAEEKRLGLWQKVREALILGRLGGGAILIGLGDDPEQPLPAKIKANQVQYLSVLSRYQLTIGEIIQDPADPLFSEPSVYMLSGTTKQTKIHPSRVVAFKGLPVPAMSMANTEDRFWGDSVIQTVDEAVKHATTASAGFAALIDEAKIDIFKFDKLAETLALDGGEDTIRKRVELTSSSKSTHRAMFMDKGDDWDQRQVTWSGMKDVIQTYDARVAGAADIPATRLFGKSPDGLNATGEGDMDNYIQSISAKQEMDLRPTLEKLDAVVLPSAGVASDLTFMFSPIKVMSEKEAAEIENKEADTVSKLVNTGLFNDKALSKSASNRMIESGRWPGYQEAVEEFGEELPDDEDPSALTQQPEGGDPNLAAGVNDAAPRTLYVSRKLLNADELIRWANKQGFETTLAADDMHITIAYSRTAVDWMAVGSDWSGDDKGHVTVRAGGARLVEPLGSEGAVVLLFKDDHLEWRHERIKEAGASWDYPEYQPHVTISYEAGNVDLSQVQPYTGPLVFGPEIFEELNDDWEVGKGAEVPFEDGRVYRRDRLGRFAASGVGGFSPKKWYGGSPVTNHAAIKAATGIDVSGLKRAAQGQNLNHAARYSKSGRVPPSRAVLKSYAKHAPNAHTISFNGSLNNGAGLRIRSEIKINGRDYTLVERVGRKRGHLALLTMWENV